MSNISFSKNILKDIDLSLEVATISSTMREYLKGPLKRRGLVIAISGGIDSSLCLALAVKAVGPKKTFCLQMPEAHSSEDTLGLSTRLAEHFGVEALHEDIPSILTTSSSAGL